jgi:hypothetical protein
MLGWDRYGFCRKCDRTRYAELVFLHPVGSTGHVVHPGGGERRRAIFLASVGPVRIPQMARRDTLR